MKPTFNWQDKSILVVDDVKLNQLLLKLILEPTKIKHFQAENVKQFFELIKEHKFDVIIMDVYLSDDDLTGIDLIRYMQTNNINTPVFISTAYDTEDIDLDDLKFDGYLKKPIKPEVVLNQINKIFLKSS
jgi:CheY-like chemotaxis protein